MLSGPCKSELSIVKTMSGNGVLIQISKNKSLIFTIKDEKLG